MKRTYKRITLITAFTILLLGGLFWLAQPSPSSQETKGQNTTESQKGVLTTEEPSIDFGAVSMAAGKVSTTFTVKNSSPQPAVVTKVYTSCMCTTAKLETAKKTIGPFGMPGHGIIPKINQTIAPNEEVKVVVTFDPAAHGPAGIGFVERVVYLEQQGGKPLELKISASVTP